MTAISQKKKRLFFSRGSCPSPPTTLQGVSAPAPGAVLSNVPISLNSHNPRPRGRKTPGPTDGGTQSLRGVGPSVTRLLGMELRFNPRRLVAEPPALAVRCTASLEVVCLQLRPSAQTVTTHRTACSRHISGCRTTLEVKSHWSFIPLLTASSIWAAVKLALDGQGHKNPV